MAVNRLNEERNNESKSWRYTVKLSSAVRYVHTVVYVQW
jgi:hypothetical protein